jgi:hypothetical protein
MEEEENKVLKTLTEIGICKKPIKGFFDSLNNKFIQLSLNIQILSFYLLLLTLFMGFMAIYKEIVVGELLKILTLNYYINSFVTDIISPQLDYKANIDQLNNINQVTSTIRNVIFMNIYSQELISHHIGTVNSKDFGDNDLTYKTDLKAIDLRAKYNYSELQEYGPNSLNYTVFDIGEREKTPVAGEDFSIDPKNLHPMIWQFTPIFAQLHDLTGIKLESGYFLGYRTEDCYKIEDAQKFNSFFKYPVRNDEILMKEYDSNLKVFDTIIEPIGNCFKYLLDKKSSVYERVNKVNWYAVYEANFIAMNTTIDSNTFKLLKLDQNRVKRTVFMTVSSFKLNFGGLKDYIFSFIHQTDVSNSFLPYQGYNNHHKEMKFSSSFSLLEKLYNWKIQKIPFNPSDNIYLNSYNVDDSSKLLYFVPRFILDLFMYGVVPKDVYEIEKSKYKDTNNYGELVDINLDTKMFDNYFLDNYSIVRRQDFLISHPFSYDLIFFQFVNFISEYMHKKKISKKNYCIIRKLKEYYNFLNEFEPNKDSTTTCIKDICKIIDCSIRPELQKFKLNPLEMTNHLPNCYCLPLFCKDTDIFANDTVHPIFEQIMPFISNTTDLPMKCSINFLKQDSNTTENTPIYINLFYDDLHYKSDVFLFSLSLKKFVISSEILINQYKYTKQIKKYVYGSYAIACIILIVIFTNIMKKNITRTSKRISKFDNFYANVIKNSLNGLILENPKFNIDTAVINSKISDAEDKIVLLEIKEDSKDFNSTSKTEEKPGDELNSFKNLINNNMDIFKVDFTIDQKFYGNNKIISSLKKEFLKDKYTEILLVAKNAEDSFNESQVSDNDNQNLSIISESSLTNNMNFYLLYELISTEILDFNMYIQNFYFNENSEPKLIDYYSQIESLLLNDEISINEVTDFEKTENFINYYLKEIHSKWMEKYDSKKKH